MINVDSNKTVQKLTCTKCDRPDTLYIVYPSIAYRTLNISYTDGSYQAGFIAPDFNLKIPMEPLCNEYGEIALYCCMCNVLFYTNKIKHSV